MYNRIPALYNPRPTLSKLYEDDDTLFSGMLLPEGLDGSDMTALLLLKYDNLETIFKTSTEAKAGITAWSKIMLENWTKMWEALQTEYAPLENYSMTETMTDDETVTKYGKSTERTDDLTHAKTGTETTTPDLTEEETPDETNTTDSGIFGFNSSTAVSDSTATETRTGTNTRTTTGTTETEYDTTDTDSGTQTIAESGSDTQTRNYTLTRAGNIGVTTSQQMLESEMILRCKWNMYEIIACAFQHDLCIVVW